MIDHIHNQHGLEEVNGGKEDEEEEDDTGNNWFHESNNADSFEVDDNT